MMEYDLNAMVEKTLRIKLHRLQPEVVFTTEICNGLLYAVGWEKLQKPTSMMSRYHLYVIGSGVSEVVFHESNVCPVGCYDIKYLKKVVRNFYTHTLKKMDMDGTSSSVLGT